MFFAGFRDLEYFVYGWKIRELDEIKAKGPHVTLQDLQSNNLEIKQLKRSP
jgi:hypothetical protein